MLLLGDKMDTYFKNETLYVNVVLDITFDTIAMLEKRIFRLIDDYGINKIVIHILGKSNQELLASFKRNYYHSFKGYLTIL